MGGEPREVERPRRGLWMGVLAAVLTPIALVLLRNVLYIGGGIWVEGAAVGVAIVLLARQPRTRPAAVGVVVGCLLYAAFVIWVISQLCFDYIGGCP